MRLLAALLFCSCGFVVTVASANTNSPARSTPAPASHSGEDVARMTRMAQNLMRPELKTSAEQAGKVRSEWLRKFNAAVAPTARMEIVTELAQLDEPETIRLLLDLVKREPDPLVRRQVELMLGFMRSALGESGSVCPAMHDAYAKTSDAEEKSAILGVISNLRTRESFELLRVMFSESGSPTDKLQLASAVFLLSPRVENAYKNFTAQATGWLKEQAKNSASGQTRLAAIRVLAAPGQENKAFLRSLAQTEQDPAVRKFCVLASVERPTE
jgi:HEAT repeat protein